MSTKNNTPELVCTLDQKLHTDARSIESLARRIQLYAQGEEFPGWAALHACAHERLPEERFHLPYSASRSLCGYPQNLARSICDGDIHLSVLLDTIGGSVGYIGLFRAAARHILEDGGGSVRTFAVRAYSAGAHIGMTAPQEQRFVTRAGQYLWHTADWYQKEPWGKQEWMKDILGIQQELLFNVSREQRQRMHRLLLGVLADERNTRYEIVLNGRELQDFGIVQRASWDCEEMAANFAQSTGIRPDFFIPGRDPIARFFSRAALEEKATEQGYSLSFSRSNTVRLFSLRGIRDRRKRNWRDVREELLDYAAEFPWRMSQVLEGRTTPHSMS